jgi:hypothetical protein
MNEPVGSAYRRLAEAQPLVRPTYNQFEVQFLPPYGDPEVHVPSEVGTYFVTGLFVNVLLEFLQNDSNER